ncbi:MAG: hypothetical protein FWC84_02365 [Alphaproteobacteria bacterium]|nr:hypothetical protein [Alphaproteobacteria bacterium]
MWGRGLGPPVSEAELHGFVDGGLDRARREFVEAHLAATPTDAARVATWRAQNEWVRGAFAEIKSPPPAWPAPPEPKLHCEAVAAVPHKLGHAESGGEARSWRERGFWPFIGLALAIGGLIQSGAEHLVLAYGPLASEDRRIVPPLAPSNSHDMAQGRAGEAGSKSLSEAAAPLLPNLTFDSYRLTGVQSLPGNMGQKLCLFYARPNSGLLSFCVEPMAGPSESAPELSSRSPTAAINWRQAGAEYTLTGPLAMPELRALAESARTQIEAFESR